MKYILAYFFLGLYIGCSFIYEEIAKEELPIWESILGGIIIGLTFPVFYLISIIYCTYKEIKRQMKEMENKYYYIVYWNGKVLLDSRDDEAMYPTKGDAINGANKFIQMWIATQDCPPSQRATVKNLHIEICEI